MRVWTPKRARRAALLLAVLSGAGACSAITGLDDFELSAASSGGSSTSTTTTSSAGGAGGAGGATSSSSTTGPGGAGGAGGAGGGTGGGPTSPCGGAWAYRHATADAALPSGLAIDADGNVVLATAFTGNPDPTLESMGPLEIDGGTSVLIVKRDPQGAVLWAKAVDATSGFDTAEAVAVSAATGLIYVTGQVSAGTDFGGGLPQGINGPSMFIAAFQPDGAHEWDFQLPTSHGHSIAMAANSVVMGGHSTDAISIQTQGGPYNIDYGGGPSDALVGRITSNNFWALSFGDDKAQRANGVAIQSGGEVIIAGEFDGTIDFGNGNSETSVNALDGFIGKVSGGQGSGIGSVAIHGDTTQSVRAVAVDASNNVVFAATVREDIDIDGNTLPGGANEDILIGKLGPGLEVATTDDERWLKRFEANDDQRATAVHVDKEGTIYLAGSLKGTIDFGDGVTLTVPTYKFSAFVAAFDSTGKALFARASSVAGQDVFATGVAADDCNNILFSGTYNGALTIDATTLPDETGVDSFLARILPVPAIP